MIKEESQLERERGGLPHGNELMESFFFQLVRMRKTIFRKTSDLLSEADIHLQMEQLPLIVILLKNKMLSQRELSDITMRDKSSVLRSISALQKKGLVMVEQDWIDKRKNNISLTDAGIALAYTIKFIMRRSEQELLSVFSEEERVIALQTVRGYADRLEGI